MKRYLLQFTSSGELVSAKAQPDDVFASEPSCNVAYGAGSVSCTVVDRDFTSALRSARKCADFGVGDVVAANRTAQIEFLLEADKALAESSSHGYVTLPVRVLRFLRDSFPNPIGYGSLAVNAMGEAAPLSSL